jgi:hypothetical protein
MEFGMDKCFVKHNIEYQINTILNKYIGSVFSLAFIKSKNNFQKLLLHEHVRSRYMRYLEPLVVKMKNICSLPHPGDHWAIQKKAFALPTRKIQINNFVKSWEKYSALNPSLPVKLFAQADNKRFCAANL